MAKILTYQNDFLKPLVTVVIPTYNRADIFTRAIDSVLTQTFTQWNLSIVDDGSNDETQKIINDRYANDPKINYLIRPETRTKGANACRNIGIEKATTKYVALLDSDDEWASKHLEKCCHFAEAASGFQGSYTSEIIYRGPFKIKHLSRSKLKSESHFDFLLGSGFAQTSSYFIKTESANKIKFDEGLQRHQDFDFFIRFGNELQWSFNPSMEIVRYIHLKPDYSNIKFESCIKFYAKNKHKITDKSLEINYIESMYEKSIITHNKKGEEFYGNRLGRLGKLKKKEKHNHFIYRFYFKIKQSYLFNYIKYFLKKIINIFKHR